MKSINRDIKEAIKKVHIYQYEVANKMGIAETTLCRWLRYELTEDKRMQIENAISELSNK